ncbi:MAG: ribonuclease H-like domain-containing protein [Terracidiphilus sp.]
MIRGSSITSRALTHRLQTYLPQTLRAIQDGNAAFFKRLGGFGESWRLFSEFAGDCVYVDIETTGLSAAYDDITVVGTSDGKNFKVFVKGDNLRDLASELNKHSVAVTFNGSGFDLPFLRKSFARSIPLVHIDLRWVAYKLGYRGGLKEIERKLGIKRPKRIADMDGFEAIILWQQYRRGDKHALERLIEYNRSDVMNLKGMMQHCYDRLLDQHSKLFRRKM